MISWWNNMINTSENKEQNRINQNLIRSYIRNNNELIKNRGYIDNQKKMENTRVLSINVNRLSLQNDKKINHIINKYQE